MTAARRKVPSWLLPVLGYLLSAACLTWVLHGYDLHQLAADLRTLDWKWVFVAVVTDLAVYVCQGWRWNTLLGPVSALGFWRTVQSIFIGLFANDVLPLRTGEVIRCYLLAHWNNLRFSLVFTSAVVERVIDGLWMLIAFFITAGFVKSIPPQITFLVQGLAVLLVIAAIILIWVVVHKHHTHPTLSESRWASTVRHIVEGLQLMGNRRTLVLTVLISLLYMALQVVTVWALMLAYGLDYSFWVAGGVLTLVRVFTMVPNAPGNLGVVNAACVMALRLFELETNDAKTFSLLFFAAHTLPPLIAGAIATALTGVNIGELRNRARTGSVT